MGGKKGGGGGNGTLVNVWLKTETANAVRTALNQSGGNIPGAFDMILTKQTATDLLNALILALGIVSWGPKKKKKKGKGKKGKGKKSSPKPKPSGKPSAQPKPAAKPAAKPPSGVKPK